MIDKIKALVFKKDICVLATVSEKRPHCSLMAYVADENAEKFYMTTSNLTKKYANIENNPNVSLLVDSREKQPRTHAQALTVSGVCETISSDDSQKATLQKMLLKKHPHLETILEKPDSEILCVKAQSYLFLDGLVDAHFIEIA